MIYYSRTKRDYLHFHLLQWHHCVLSTYIYIYIYVHCTIRIRLEKKLNAKKAVDLSSFPRGLFIISLSSSSSSLLLSYLPLYYYYGRIQSDVYSCFYLIILTAPCTHYIFSRLDSIIGFLESLYGCFCCCCCCFPRRKNHLTSFLVRWSPLLLYTPAASRVYLNTPLCTAYTSVYDRSTVR